MISGIRKKQSHPIYRLISGFVAFAFIFGSVVPPTNSYAQIVPATVLNLPAPGAMIPLSSGFNPPIIDGITIHPDDPFTFDFLVDRGDHNLQGKEFQAEAKKLIKYFMASLTVPEEELWVNLSPYENDRIIPESLSRTEMGQDLLAQDYMLKQLTASLMYPENELGEKFWNRIRDKVQKTYGTSELPVDTFNKVWIVPQDATVYETENTAIVIDSYLKVMLESDYLALENAKNKTGNLSLGETTPNADIIKEIIIPAIEKEVNEGETFANLRQVYNSMILATWYKKNLKESLLGQVYIDQNKVSGIDTVSGDMKDKIYKQYLEAFNVGVYNYIKEDTDPNTQEIIPRKYFAGGITAVNPARISSPLEGDIGAVRAAMSLSGNDEGIRVVLEGVGGEQLAAASSVQDEPASSPILDAATQATLMKTAAAMVPVNGGIMAADESIGSAKQRLDMVGLENTYENRQLMRNLMLTTPGIENSGITAVILADDTFSNVVLGAEEKLVDNIAARGIAPGIKTDKKLIPDPDSEGETIPNPAGLEELPAMLQEFKAQGAVFTKWRTTQAINAQKGFPTNANIRKNAVVQAKQSKMTQEAGLVPIFEPEVLLNGAHDINASYDATVRTLEITFEELEKEGAWLPGAILKTSMILSGDKATNRANPDEVGFLTLVGLLRSVPAAIPAVVFLSGGQADDEVKRNLEGVIRASQQNFQQARDAAVAELMAEGKEERAHEVASYTEAPWQISYSFGRGLQRPALLAWGGQAENFDKAQTVMLKTAREVQSARLGQLNASSPLAFGENAFKKGGIDLDAEHLNLKVKRDGNGIPLPVSMQPLEIININGLVPVIINVAPVNMPLIFGSLYNDNEDPLAETNPRRSLDSARNQYFDKMVAEEKLTAI